jgi:hypothetical protein
MAYENYTLGQFKRAWFKSDRSETGIPDSDFEIVYTEYIDTVGAYKSDQFDKAGWIKHLEAKINTVTIWIKIQRDFISDFGRPFVERLAFMEEFGHYIEYTDNDSFFVELEKIEQDLKGDISELNGSIKELEDIKKSEPVVEVTLKERREAFVRNQNTLGKIGYKIDEDKTSVEEYALMIKQQNEENER